MRIVVNERCEGHNRCVDTAPEVFAASEDDRSVVLLDPIPEEYRAKVERAVRLCPRQALELVND